MKTKCPYCSTIINDTDTVCGNCHNDLTVHCPYCNEEIKAYDEVCPKCSTQLKKKDYSQLVLTMGIIINLIWLLSNILVLVFLGTFPQIFKLPDENPLELLVDLGRIGIPAFGVLVVPYIIAIVKNYKKGFAISALVLNFILAVIFMVTLSVLYYKYS